MSPAPLAQLASPTQLPPRAAPPCPPPLPPPLPRLRHAAARGHEPAGARAVEVAAMLGDSVVGVKHCMDPRRGGRVSPLTWALLAGAAACLIASAIAFVASLHTAADNRARFDAWTRVQHRPARAFRAAQRGPAGDAVAFGGLGLALVGAGLGLARLRRERVDPHYRIGTAPGVDLAIAGAPAAAFPLVAPSGDDFVFHFVPGAPGSDGELMLDGGSTPLAELAATGRAQPSAHVAGALALAIPPGARIRARLGLATLLISSVARPRRSAVPLLARVERRVVGYGAGSLIAHLALWGLLQLIPPAATSISVELPVVEPIAVSLRGAAHEDRTPPPADGAGEGSGEAGGPAMALPSGTAGDPAAVDHGRRQLARADEPLERSRGAAIAAAREAGLLGNEALRNSIDLLAELPGIAAGFDPRTIHGPIIGADGGGGPGEFGGGFVGLWAGGGCGEPPCGSMPSGGYATIHDGPGGGSRYGLPGRDLGHRMHHPVLPRIGRPDVIGAGYDKSVIRRYIRRSIDKIAYCYDRQLLAHPALGGELTVSFFIAPSGEVQRASATGFDREVAACVAGVIQTIAFPRPGDGAGVQVNYPFQFHPAGR